MSCPPTTVLKHPDECSQIELADFVALVRAGEEVATAILEERVRAAERLTFLFKGKCLLGIAALKNPLSSYRKSVSAKSGFILDAVAFPYELGYVFVLPSARGRRLSNVLVSSIITHIASKGIWATSRTDNHVMHRTLLRYGFAVCGQPYTSGRGKHQLQLFSRPAAQPSAASDAPQASRR